MPSKNKEKKSKELLMCQTGIIGSIICLIYFFILFQTGHLDPATLNPDDPFDPGSWLVVSYALPFAIFIFMCCCSCSGSETSRSVNQTPPQSIVATKKTDAKKRTKSRPQQTKKKGTKKVVKQQSIAPPKSVRNKTKIKPLEGPTLPGLSILRQYEYLGGKVRVKVKVINESAEGLLRVALILNVPESFRLLRIEPNEYARVSSMTKLNDLIPGEEKTVAWVLEPLICGKECIGGSVSGVDARGNPFALPMKQLNVQVSCPLFAKPEEINLPNLQRIIRDLSVQSERVYLLPEQLTPEDALDLVKVAIGERDVRFVGSVGEDTGDQTSAYFYGVTKVGQQRYVLTATISKKDQIIRLATACDDEAGCTGFLAESGASIRKQLVQRGAVDSEEGVVELICEKCGATLPKAPIIGRDVACPGCRWKWRAGDFFY